MDRTPLHQLTQQGQSVWLDFISRELVTTDQLDRLITEDAVTGMTSNPTIFEKAIAEGEDYDEQLRQLLSAGVTSPDELFVELAVSDIQHAADTLRSIHDGCGGCDGFVSLEVAPDLADDTEATVAAAKYLWEKVERPNLMIKVPATPAGIPAIERLIGDGLNINVTLIFALSAYEAVAEAYIRGLERRAAEGRPVDNRSVASFFVSRVDTAVDKLLEEKLKERPDDEGLRSLLGTAAIANAKLAYESFHHIFRGERFAPLRERGAAVQRPLWASTSAKNPAYRDVVYAEELIGPDTVDTMPLATIEAFHDHGVVRGDTVCEDWEGAHRVMDRLRAAGIDIDRVTEDLMHAGVKSFADSYNQLIRRIAEKSETMRGGPGGRQRLDLGALGDRVDAELARARDAGVVRRVWERDPDLWKPGDEAHARVIRNRLGWLDVVETMRRRVAELRGFADEVRDAGIRDVVLLGMGGSSLCPEVLRTSFGSAEGRPTLHVLDTTDPAAILAVDGVIDPRTTLFLVSSKSGGTIETLSHMAHCWDMVTEAGVDRPGDHFVAITDPGTSLAVTARERGFRRVFENPSDIGGRYSALSCFGLVPAALIGVDLDGLLDRAAAMLDRCRPEVHPSLNSGLLLGCVIGALHDEGRDKVTILAPPRIAAFSLWAEQLLAESTGKEGKGLIPVGSEPIGAPEVYGDDRLFVVLRLAEDAAFDGAVQALRDAGHPVVTLELTALEDLAAEFARWEFATAVAGWHLGIDPFDEPNVQESKDNTRRLLDVVEREGSLPSTEEPSLVDSGIAVDGAEAGASDAAGAVGRLLDSARRGDYVALMAYVTPTNANEDVLQALRTAIRDRTRLATTLGFGPRFLHSTGQLHKGGPNTGVFLQITVDDTADVPIPGAPYGFSMLKRAQARGDLESLRNHGRRVLRLHLGATELAGGVRRLTDSLRRVTASPR
jgi:transaldolase / glucose-6-phosphate isomerase